MGRGGAVAESSADRPGRDLRRPVTVAMAFLVVVVALLGKQLAIAHSAGITFYTSLGDSGAWRGVGECEGYWPDVSACLPAQGGTAAEDCPQQYVDTDWPGKHGFLEKVKAMETAASTVAALRWQADDCALADHIHGISKTQYRGLSWSRMQEGEIVGSAEFKDTIGGVCWPDGYTEHYVGEHNVKPSNRFLKYVDDFDLTAFKAAVDDLVACVHDHIGT